MQVHEEVLRLFSATVSKLSAEQLAKYLQMTLQHSRKSRKCVFVSAISYDGCKPVVPHFLGVYLALLRPCDV